MAGKLFSTIGVAALIALGLGGFAALAVVKDRVTLVVQADEDQAARGPEPLELVRAEVATLREDLNAFVAALGPQLEQLHAALDSEASAREQAAQAHRQTQSERAREQAAAVNARIEALSNAFEATKSAQAQALTRVEGSLAALATADAQAREAALADAQRRAEELARAEQVRSAAAAAAATTAAERAAELAAEQATPDAAATQRRAEETAAGAASGAAPKKSFLSFSLPSQSFQFEGRQRLAIVPSLSRVGFDAKSTLHDFSGVTQKVDGELEVDLSAPSAGCSGTVSADARSLDTGLADRDEGMRERLDVGRHPQLRFEWTAFRDARVDAAAQTVAGTAVGKLTLRGVAREVELPVRVSVDASKRVAIEGELTLKMSTFGIEPPSQLGMIKVEDDVKLWIALRARSLGAATQGAGAGAGGGE